MGRAGGTASIAFMDRVGGGAGGIGFGAICGGGSVFGGGGVGSFGIGREWIIE